MVVLKNDATRLFMRAGRSFAYAHSKRKAQEMPIIRTRDAVFLVGTAMGIAASSGGIQAEPRGLDDARIILAQAQQNDAEEEKKRRERRREEPKSQGGSQGQGGQGQGQGGGQGGNRRELQGQGQGQGNQGQGQGGGQGGNRRELQGQGQGQGNQGQGQGQGGGQGGNRRELQGQGQGQGNQGQGQGGGQGGNRRELQGQGQGQGQGGGQGGNRRELQGQGQGQGNQGQGQGGGQGGNRRELQGQGQGQGNQGQGQGGGQGGNRRELQGQGNQGQGPDKGQIQDPRLGQDKAGKDGPGDARRSERALRNREKSGEDRLRDGVISSDQQKLGRKQRGEFSSGKLKDVTRQRRERKLEGGRVVIEESDNRSIERDGGKVIIRNDETERLKGASSDFRVEKGEGGKSRTIIKRSDGVEIITIKDENNHLLRRIKRFPDGREKILINNEYKHEGRYRDRRRHRDGRGDGGGGGGGFEFYLELPEVVLNIPQDEYFVDADDASGEEIEQALSAEPVEDIEGDYTLDEIRYNRGLRQRLRRVNLDSINFEFGAWDIRQEQVGNLQEVADAIKNILRRNPDEVFLVGGHTDAVGSDEDNLSLSDRRAETVARVLTDEFGVPPENLVTQGYGEQDQLIATTEPEIRNRRVEFMRITPFLAQKDE